MVVEILSGRCLCGAVRFQFEGPPSWTVYCHCESCRRATSSPATVWICVPRTAFTLIRGEPRFFVSSPGVRRGFCGDCGSPLSYEAERAPDEIHLCAASLDQAAELIPERHVHVADQLPWFEVLDSLPRYDRSSRGDAVPVGVGPRVTYPAPRRNS